MPERGSRAPRGDKRVESLSKFEQLVRRNTRLTSDLKAGDADFNFGHVRFLANERGMGGGMEEEQPIQLDQVVKIEMVSLANILFAASDGPNPPIATVQMRTERGIRYLLPLSSQAAIELLNALQASPHVLRSLTGSGSDEPPSVQ